ncbi:response regulator [Paenibacillus sp. PL91]|uniref:response regulator n=1 Tax=Paenibacillus sp. PL91 TaxID=2729538 RepID=UPI00294FFCC7|nr:response regulator [Paenibacillus sp. PL91]
MSTNYYQVMMAKETDRLTTNTIQAMANNVEANIEELDHLMTSLYMNQSIMQALQLFGTADYDSLDELTKFNANKALFQLLPSYLQYTNDNILGSVIIASNGITFSTNKYDSKTILLDNYPYREKEWYNEAIKAEGKTVLIDMHETDYYSGTSTPTEAFSIAKAIKDPNSSKIWAVVMADAKSSALENIVKNINFSDRAIVTVLDRNNRVLYANKLVEENMINQLTANKSTIKDGNDTYIKSSQLILGIGWKMVVLSSYTEMQLSSKRLYNVSVLFSALCVLTAFALYFASSRRMMDSLKSIIATIRKVERGDLGAHLSIAGKDEIAQVGAALNHMVYTLRDLIEREYKAVLGQRNAEYHALQMQIQPHFLYNTLTGLMGLNRMGDRIGLEKSILSLTSMLRYTLEQDNWSTVDKEMQFITNYCNLQKYRFEDRMAFHVFYDEETAACPIPKLLLQPLVENAVIHGLEPLSRPCTIDIAATIAYKEDISYLTLTVKDDGAGFDHDNVAAKKPNIGTSNIKERLSIAFEDYHFSIVSNETKERYARLKLITKRLIHMKVLIADDERMVRVVLRSTLEEVDSSLTIVGEAKDGNELLELAALYKPNIAFVDIKMPELDGLTAINQGKMLSPSTHWIILTGFSYFEYAQEAIKLGAYAYLLKPIDPQKLNELLKEIKLKLMAEMEAANKSFKRDLIANYFIHLYDRELEQTFEGREIGGFLLIKDSSWSEARQVVVLTDFFGRLSGLNSELTPHAIHTAMITMSNGDVACIYGYDPSCRILAEQISDQVLRMLDELNDPQFHLTMLAFQSTKDLADLYRQSDQLKLNKHLRVLSGFQNKQCLNDLEQIANVPVMDKLCKRVIELCDSYKDELLLPYSDQIKEIRKIVAENTSIDRLDNNTKIADFIYCSIGCLLEAEQGLYSMLRTLELYGGNIKHTRADTSDLIEQIVEYIEANYMKEISISEIADHLKVTANYVSRIFHQKKGMRFIDFLTEVRIAHAKKLFYDHPKMPVKEVAARVGYFSTRYFSKLFLKEVGSYPSDFAKNPTL